MMSVEEAVTVERVAARLLYTYTLVGDSIRIPARNPPEERELLRRFRTNLTSAVRAYWLGEAAALLQVSR